MTRDERKVLTYNLQEWGAWRRQDCLGYPKMTAEAKILCSPGRSFRIDHSPNYKQSPIGRRTEESMKLIDAYYQNLLWLFYVQQAKEAMIRQYARVSRQTRGAYRWQLEKAHKELGQVVFNGRRS